MKSLVSLFAFGAFCLNAHGVSFGLGFVALILIHEMGHFMDIRLRGLPADMPVFLPGRGLLKSISLYFHLAFLLLLMMCGAVPTFCGESLLLDQYRQLKAFELDGKAAKLENLQVKRDRFACLLDYQARVPGSIFGINGGEKGLFFKYQDEVNGYDVWTAVYDLEEMKRGVVAYSDTFDIISVSTYRMEIDLTKPESVELDPDLWVLSEKTSTRKL